MPAPKTSTSPARPINAAGGMQVTPTTQRRLGRRGIPAARGRRATRSSRTRPGRRRRPPGIHGAAYRQRSWDSRNRASAAPCSSNADSTCTWDSTCASTRAATSTRFQKYAARPSGRDAVLRSPRGGHPRAHFPGGLTKTPPRCPALAACRAEVAAVDQPLRGILFARRRRRWPIRRSRSRTSAPANADDARACRRSGARSLPRGCHAAGRAFHCDALPAPPCCPHPSAPRYPSRGEMRR